MVRQIGLNSNTNSPDAPPSTSPRVGSREQRPFAFIAEEATQNFNHQFSIMKVFLRLHYTQCLVRAVKALVLSQKETNVIIIIV